MNHREFSFSAEFSMFAPDGLRLNFAVAADTAAKHLDDLHQYVNRLSEMGFSVNLPGVEDGEKIEAVDAWVLGETSKGEPCIYLYSANHGLQWRIATVYVEKMADLPFDTSKGKLWPGDAAPSRDTAEAKKYIVHATEFRIVMANTGKLTEAGNPIFKYARVFGIEKSATKPATNGHRPTTNATIPGDALGLPDRMEDYGEPLDPNPAKVEAAQTITPGQMKRLHALGTEVYGKANWDAKRAELVQAVTKGASTSSSELTPAEAQKLITGLEAKLEPAA